MKSGPIALVTLVVLAQLDGSMAHGAPRLGAAVLRADGAACVTMQGEPLRAGTGIVFILFSPPRVVDGAVRGKAVSPCNNALPATHQSYAVQLRYPMGAGEVGIAVYSPGARVEYSAGEFVLHTSGAKTPLSFRQCASQEGLHLTAWRGNRRTWHEYWYAGMDLESNCTDEEMENR